MVLQVGLRSILSRACSSGAGTISVWGMCTSKLLTPSSTTPMPFPFNMDLKGKNAVMQFFWATGSDHVMKTNRSI